MRANQFADIEIRMTKRMPSRTLCVCVAVCCAVPAPAANFPAGLGRAKDGDSLLVGDTEVRLFGIDAPESDQTCRRGTTIWACGSEAADRLSALVTGKEVQCTSMGMDQHRRVLGRCTVGMTDINRAMVATGYAVAYRHYSSDYISVEESAKANRRGIWSGTFEMPGDYRHDGALATRRPVSRRSREPLPEVVQIRPSAESGGCVIKGNQGSNGWIYHVPGMPYYAQTRAEQMFCSESDARAAGYRRAKVR